MMFICDSLTAALISFCCLFILGIKVLYELKSDYRNPYIFCGCSIICLNVCDSGKLGEIWENEKSSVRGRWVSVFISCGRLIRGQNKTWWYGSKLSHLRKIFVDLDKSLNTRPYIFKCSFLKSRFHRFFICLQLSRYSRQARKHVGYWHFNAEIKKWQSGSSIHSGLDDIKWKTDAGKITVWLLKTEWHEKSLSKGENSSTASPMVLDADSSLCPPLWQTQREKDTQ